MNENEDLNYRLYDRVVNDSIYLFHSKLKNVDAVVLRNFNPKSYRDKLMLTLLELYTSIAHKQVYLDMPWWKYLIFKIKNFRNHNYARYKVTLLYNFTYAALSTEDFLNELADSEQIDKVILFDIYMAYYKGVIK